MKPRCGVVLLSSLLATGLAMGCHGRGGHGERPPDRGLFPHDARLFSVLAAQPGLAQLDSLRKLGVAFGADYTLCTPASGDRGISLRDMARDIARRMIRIFLVDEHGRRPVFGGATKFQNDPSWRDHVLFYEYFHGDNGAGIGASHQTGWTALVAKLLQQSGEREPARPDAAVALAAE